MEIAPSVKPLVGRPLAPVPAHAGYASPPRYAERHCQVSSGTRLALIALGGESHVLESPIGRRRVEHLLRVPSTRPGERGGDADGR
jgi:hypothetical protein